MTMPAVSTARGIFLRGCSISSPMMDAPSTPLYANAIPDQKIMSFRPVLGMKSDGDIGVAEPYRFHDTRPNTINSAVGIHAATAPTLVSHFPTLRPTMLRPAARTRPAIDTVMKYQLLDESDCHDPPPMNSALPATK